MIVEFNDQLHSALEAHKAGPAFGLWVRSVLYVCRHGLPLPLAEVPPRDPSGRLTPLLVGAGLWERDEAGWLVLNPSLGDRPAFRVRFPKSKVSTAVRRLVFERDGRVCVECGATEDLTLDHIWPRVRGGLDHPENLRVLCRSCNSAKGARV